MGRTEAIRNKIKAQKGELVQGKAGWLGGQAGIYDLCVEGRGRSAGRSKMGKKVRMGEEELAHQ